MDYNLLAKQLWAAEGPILDSQGLPVPPTTEMKAYAQGFVKMFQAGIANNLPGTVMGSAPPGGDMKTGSAMGGKIAGLAGPVMSAITAKANPVVAPKLILEAMALALYSTGAASVSFSAGAITGKSTATPTAPGPITLGAGAPIGKISGLVGSAMANKVKALTLTTGPKMVAHYTVMANFIMANATVEYKSGSVVGTFSGSALTAGAAMGGKIK